MDQQKVINGRYAKHPWTIRGVSDVVAILPMGRVAWIEVKTLEGKLSRYQETFRDRVRSLGHEYVVVRSLHDIKAWRENETN